MNYSWPWQGFLRNLVEIRSKEAMLTQYVAVLAGARRALDDWIPARHFNAFLELMKKHGLVVEVDCVFKHLAEESEVKGKNLAPTTRAVGVSYRDGMDEAPGTEAHVIVSSRADWAAETLAAGWYPVYVDSRMVRKPQVDHRWLGVAFGYPECCVDFFINHNDWPRFNTLADAANASSTLRWETNCLLKHSPWSTLFHMPCSFDCPATINYTNEVLQAVRELDAGYAEHIQASLKQHFLMISEGLCYMLAGAREGREGRTAYEKAVYVGGYVRYDHYSNLLASGNELKVSDGMIFIWRDGELIESIETRCDQGIAEVPMVFGFV
jgi:hypothetical protein